LNLAVILARRQVPAAFKITIGSTIGFDQHVDAPVEILLDGHAVALGEVGVREDRYAVRVVRVLEPRHPAPAPGTLEVVLAERDDHDWLSDPIGPAKIIEFDKRQHDTVDLLRDGRLTARGYIQALGDRVGIKIVELVVT
jgi:flagellar motor switch/type III secretory pathway protein FliN